MIQINLTWDLSATISQTNTNNEKLNTKITGRFKPDTATPEKIKTLAAGFINKFTTNAYTDATLTVKKSLSELDNEEVA